MADPNGSDFTILVKGATPFFMVTLMDRFPKARIFDHTDRTNGARRLEVKIGEANPRADSRIDGEAVKRDLARPPHADVTITTQEVHQLHIVTIKGKGREEKVTWQILSDDTGAVSYTDNGKTTTTDLKWEGDKGDLNAWLRVADAVDRLR